MKKNHSEIYYLDDENHIVDQALATKAIIRELDINGRLLNETILLKEQEKKEKKELILSEEEKEFLKQVRMNRASRTFRLSGLFMWLCKKFRNYK